MKTSPRSLSKPKDEESLLAGTCCVIVVAVYVTVLCKRAVVVQSK